MSRGNKRKPLSQEETMYICVRQCVYLFVRLMKILAHDVFVQMT